MISKEFKIKKSAGHYGFKGLFYLIMLIISLCFAFSPKLYNYQSDYKAFVVWIGYAWSLYFGYLFVSLLVRSFKPADAIILTENGISDFTTGSKGIYIDWGNVSGIKLIGSTTRPMLGIELYDIEQTAATAKRYVAEEMRSNAESGLPPIVVEQSEIRPKLSQILPAFNDFLNSAKLFGSADQAGKYKAGEVKIPPVPQNIPDADDTTDTEEDTFIFFPATEGKKKFLPTSEFDRSENDIIIPWAAETADEEKPAPKKRGAARGEKNIKTPDFYTDSLSEPTAEFTMPKFSDQEEIVIHSLPDIKEQPAAKPEAAKAPEQPKPEAEKPAEESKAAEKIPSGEIKTIDELLASFSIPVMNQKEEESGKAENE